MSDKTFLFSQLVLEISCLFLLISFFDPNQIYLKIYDFEIGAKGIHSTFPTWFEWICFVLILLVFVALVFASAGDKIYENYQKIRGDKKSADPESS